jgi:hypothetical protein
MSPPPPPRALFALFRLALDSPFRLVSCEVHINRMMAPFMTVRADRRGVVDGAGGCAPRKVSKIIPWLHKEFIIVASGYPQKPRDAKNKQ